ncbi:MAG: FHA domain-containing protein [Methanobacterium sp.]
MTRRNIIIIIIALVALVIVLSALIFGNYFLDWTRSQWLDIIYAAIMAIVVGLIIEYLYRKYSAKSKMAQTTIIPPTKPKVSFARLVLKDKHEFLIKEYERIFGREDFLGVTVVDDLMFIGKKHFKISKEEDGFYIEDLGTKNGTMLNGEEISSKGKVKLQNEDEILVAKALSIKYYEK